MKWLNVWNLRAGTTLHYAVNASDNGYNINIDDVMEKTDWIDLLKDMMNLYFDNSQTYAQGLDCKKILDVLERIHLVHD